MSLLDEDATELLGFPVRQVAVPGRRLALRRGDPPEATAAGQNPPVLLLHGVPETSGCWRRLLPELARDRIVLAPDLPGLGDSEVRGPYDVPSVAASLVALLAAELDHVEAEPVPVPEPAASTEAPVDVDITEEPASEAEPPVSRVDVVGHDWGGSLGLAVAAARPDLVRRLVVISAPYRTVDLRHAWHIPLLGFVPPAVFTRTGPAIVRGMFGYAWKTGRPPETLVNEYARAYAAPERVRAMAGFYRAAVRHRGGRRQEGESGPNPSLAPERSLVVWGTNDPPMPLRVGESVVTDLGRVADPASVRMVTLPGVGHWPVEEVPDVVVPLLADFLRAA
jgi:haloacetate dehalogenase